MQIPLQIVADGLELSEPERDRVRAYSEKLETFFDRVMGNRVTVSVPNRWPQAGPMLYRVRIDLTVPGDELVIERQPNENRNSVLLGGFDRIEVGTEVRFAEEEGDKGPQASSVSIAGGHRIERQLSPDQPES